MKPAFKLRCNAITFNIAAALLFTLVMNAPFLLSAWSAFPYQGLHDLFFAATMPIVLFCAFLLIFNLIALPWLRKPLLTLLTLSGAAAGYFIYSFGTVIDTNMIQNVFETDAGEAQSLLSLRFVLWMILPLLAVILLWRVNVTASRPWWSAPLWRIVTSLAAVLVITLVAALFYKDYAAMVRNNKGLVKMITPVNIASGVGHYVHDRWFAGDQTEIRIGLDAHKGSVISGAEKKTLVIFVLGETARAENFSLGGYARETNPKLKQDDVIYYQHASSCGTETAISVPCMFSNMPRRHYDASLARHQEGVLDVLAHAGVNLLWRENDGGCKGVCDRVPHTDMTQWHVNALCQREGCLDEILLHQLNHYIDSVKDDTLIVLHQMGSHGPAYYQRYPAAMRQFTPTCDSNQIQDCSPQALINTYDNSILYTDTVLDSTLSLLKTYSDRFNVALIYLSDHGESLGEHGLYLHGTPYMLAPEQQTHIPLLLWLSPDYLRGSGINARCLQASAQHDAVSQDAVFHTLLGMFNIQTREYQQSLDMLQRCRQPA